MNHQRCCSLILGLILTISTAFSQSNQPASPLQHETKVYVDYEKNKIFWPFTQPFWIRLATSPAPDAPSYLLECVAPKSGKKAVQKYSTQGIELEITGSQFVRWYNYVTKDTLLLEFFADGEAPATQAAFLDAPRYSTKSTQYYGMNLTATLTPTDDLSGVAATYYSVDGAPFTVYSTAIPFGKEKLFSLRYYSLDNVGNAAKPNEVFFQVDLSPPSTHHTVQKNNLGDVLGPLALIELPTGDLLAGINSVFYKWDQEPKFQVYQNKPLEVNHLSDGNHALVYYAKDNVENNEKSITYTFYYDNTPPVGTPSIVGDEWVQEQTRFISLKSRVKLTAQDNKIGVDHIEYAFTPDKFFTYAEPVPMPSSAKGAIVFYYRSYDRLGNLSKVTNYPLIVDIEPPKSKCDFSGTKIVGQDIVWCTRTTQIILSSNDNISGLKQINYILAGKPPTTYQQPFAIESEGGYLLNFWGVDRVNNIEPFQKQVVYIDNTPPVIHHFFSIQGLDSTRTEKGEYLTYYPKAVQLFIISSDAASGVNGLWFKVDEQKETVYADPIEFKIPGEHSVVIRTVDKVMNETSKVIRFLIQS